MLSENLSSTLLLWFHDLIVGTLGVDSSHLCSDLGENSFKARVRIIEPNHSTIWMNQDYKKPTIPQYPFILESVYVAKIVVPWCNG